MQYASFRIDLIAFDENGKKCPSGTVTVGKNGSISLSKKLRHLSAEDRAKLHSVCEAFAIDFAKCLATIQEKH